MSTTKEEFAMYFFGILLCFHAFIQIAILFARILDQLDVETDTSAPVSTKINYKARFEEIIGDADKKNAYNTSAAVATDDDVTEEAWKRRILMEYVSGYGNIIMTYDYYRRGFCYYCDLSSVPYTVLIEIAYKYMLTYKCVSFADPPPEETEQECAPAPVQKRAAACQVNSLEAKLRSVETKSRTEATEEKTAAQEQQPCVKIIRLGKVCDFSFLSKPVAKVAMIETKQISYKDFISVQRRRQVD